MNKKGLYPIDTTPFCIMHVSSPEIALQQKR